VASRLGDERQVGVLRLRIAEPLEDENLSRRVGKMLLGPDDVTDFEIEIVHHARQVIEAGAIRPLNDVILLAGPFEDALAPNVVLKPALPVPRNLETDDSLPSLSRELRRLLVSLRHPIAAVEERFLFLLRLLPLGLEFLGRRKITIGQPFLQ
jgi:hypothetical protein